MKLLSPLPTVLLCERSTQQPNPRVPGQALHHQKMKADNQPLKIYVTHVYAYTYYLGACSPTSHFLLLYLIIFPLSCPPPHTTIYSPIGSWPPQGQARGTGMLSSPPREKQNSSEVLHSKPAINQLLTVSISSHSAQRSDYIANLQRNWPGLG